MELLNCTGVYRIDNIETGDFYIGSSSISFKKRKNQHFRLLRLNKNPCLFLQKAYNLYKEKNFIFSIVEVCSPDLCIQREQFYLDTLSPKYNIRKIADSSKGLKLKEETKNKIFEMMRKYKDEQVIKMFSLYNSGFSIKDIAKTLNAKPNNVSCILHKKQKYYKIKEKYNLSIIKKVSRYVGKYKIISPNYHTVIVDNLTLFAKQNNLDATCLCRCANGIYESTKGYRVEKITQSKEK